MTFSYYTQFSKNW